MRFLAMVLMAFVSSVAMPSTDRSSIDIQSEIYTADEAGDFDLCRRLEAELIAVAAAEFHMKDRRPGI